MRRPGRWPDAIATVAALALTGLAVYVGGGWGIVVVEGTTALFVVVQLLRNMSKGGTAMSVAEHSDGRTERSLASVLVGAAMEDQSAPGPPRPSLTTSAAAADADGRDGVGRMSNPERTMTTTAATDASRQARQVIGTERRETAVARPARWARRAAFMTVLTTVPSAVWRCSMALGLPVGVDPGYRRQHYSFPGAGTVHVLWISVLLLGLALLTLGLVQRWGEVLPGWVPAVGGKRVPRLAVVVLAASGAVALTLLWLSKFSSAGEIFDVFGLHGAARDLVFACYAPMLLWGPLLGAVTVSYARRTSPQSREPMVGR